MVAMEPMVPMEIMEKRSRLSYLGGSFERNIKYSKIRDSHNTTVSDLSDTFCIEYP